MSERPPDTVPAPRPRIEAEDGRASRLVLARDVGAASDGDALPDGATPPAARRGTRATVLVLAGFVVLVFGAALAGAATTVAAIWSRSRPLGIVAVAVAALGFGLVALGIGRELAALWRLRAVDRIRRDLASEDPARVVAAARRWIALVAHGRALRPALDALNDPDAVVPLLRGALEVAIRASAEKRARVAAIEVVAAMAAMPTPALVVLLVSWRGLRLIREVASLYGLRPGLLGTVALLRRTVTAATATAVTEAAVNTAAHAVLSTPLLAHVAGEMAGGAVAARRMIVLGRAAAAACSPLPPE